MKHDVELELKVLVSKSQFDSLLSFYPNIVFRCQHNYYYSSGDNSTYAFRIRKIEDDCLFTCKQKVNNSIMEHELAYRGEFTSNPDITSWLQQQNILPPYNLIGELVTNRGLYSDELAELCFDVNLYNGIVDYEIEYEVKKSHNYVASFTSILAKANIDFVSNKISKFQRCINSRLSTND